MDITRREGLGFAAIAGAAAATPAIAAKPKIDFVTKVDFKDPKWNRDTYMRLDADVDPDKEKLGWWRGKAFGVRPNEVVRPLFIFEGFSFVRTTRLPDGSWRRRLREIGFYRDLETNEILKTWRNPYTNETVNVVPIANDPYNFTIGEFRDEPSYGGLRKAEAKRKPFLLDWSNGADGTLICQIGIDLLYPAALQPDKWPRESAGVMNRVSEHFIYTMKRKDVENPLITHIPHVGAWSRTTSWLPWMLMGQAEGNVQYFTTFASLDSIADLDPQIAAAARAMGDKWFSAPTSEYGPSLSSLETYALTNKPAPVPPGWTPPKPPAAPTSLPPRKN